MKIAVLMIATVLAFGQAGQDPASINQAVKAMEQARDRKDWVQMERICRDSIKRGARLEYLVRSLSWALCRQGKTDEGFQVAVQNYEWNPCVWSVVNYIDAAMDDGQTSKAKQAAQLLVRNRQEWGSDAKIAERGIARASSKTFRLKWTVPVSRLKAGETLWIPKPMDTRNQKLTSWNVTGCTNVETKTNSAGFSYAVAKVIGSEPVEVVCEVKLSPFSVKELLGSVTNNPATEDTKPFQGMSVGNDIPSKIDPSAADVQSIVAKFGTTKPVESAERMMDWINANFTFCPVGSPPGADVVADVIKRKGGHCEAITSVEVALLRAANIPARMIRGQSAVRADMGKSTQHTIVQLWLSGIGWVDWDYFLPRWQSRDDFVRLWVYNSVGDPTVNKLADFFGRAFQELKGYRHELVGTSLD